MTGSNLLILVRHSLPEIVGGIPAYAWELSDEGRTRVERLVEILKQHQLEVIGSSVEPKARETAEILCKSLGVDILVVDGLHEHERDGVALHSKEEFQTLIRELFEKPDTLIFGSETATQALARFRESVELMMNLNGGKRMAIVTHGTVISLFTSWLTGVDGYLFWRDLGLPAIVVLDLQTRKLLETINIT